MEEDKIFIEDIVNYNNAKSNIIDEPKIIDILLKIVLI